MRNVDTSFGHASHLAAEALSHAEKVANFFEKGWAGFHGVEGSVEPDFLYLNTGNTYDPTVVATPGPWGDYRFTVASWGDLVESYQIEAD